MIIKRDVINGKRKSLPQDGEPSRAMKIVVFDDVNDSVRRKIAGDDVVEEMEESKSFTAGYSPNDGIFLMLK